VLIVWDELKRLANLAKHGLDFADIEAGFDWEAAEIETTRRRRLKAVGMLNDEAVVVIFAALGNRSHLGYQPAPGIPQGKERLVTKLPKLMKQFEPGHGFTKEDWDAVDSPQLTDAELASMRPAREVLPRALFEKLTRRGERGPQKAPTKVAISIRLSQDVIDAFKAGGPGWQSRIDEALRAAIKRSA
jgi:uncharacterized protein (DUF4415 family)/uncharacterized DUF497 family protein